MSYQVIARKWRPQTFADLVGQEHVTGTLANAIKNDRVAHAYIFSGARGVGKTTAARILAKALNCVDGPTAEPCGVCDSCKEIAAGTSLDVIEIDAASNRGIDQIRELREMVRYAPAASRHKVVILDEAHMLTGEASNALLKTLEEPPDRVIFVMATTEPEKLEDTIRSRSQHFHFRALTFNEIASRLRYIAQQENLQIEDGAVAVIARMGEGSMRDSLSLLEQARAFCGDRITDKEVRELLGVVPEDALNELVSAIAAGSAERALGLVHTFQKEGRNLQHFCREAIRHIRNLLIARVCGADSDLLAATPDQRPALAQAAALFSEEDLTRFFNILLETDEDLRRNPDPRVHLEMGLLRLIHAGRLAPLEELLAELGGETQTGAVRSAAGSRASAAVSAAPAWPAKNEVASAAVASAVGAAMATPSAAPQAPAKFSAPSWMQGNTGMSSRAAAAVAPIKTAEFTEGLRIEEKTQVPNTNLGHPPLSMEPEQDATTAEQHNEIAEGAEPAKSNGHAAVARVDAPVASAGAPVSTAETNDDAKAVAAKGLSEAQAMEIRSSIQAQQKFLGELLEHGHRWELEGAELRIFFAADKRAFAEMVEGRDSLEKIRAIAGKVLNRPVRVCAKIESIAATAPPASRVPSDLQELRAKFERDPMVRSMLQRFGGKISEVKRREEGL